MNVGIITASLSAIPQFFAKSKIFRSSTYSSLRSKLFADRGRNKGSGATSGSKQSGTKIPFESDGVGMHGDGYLELGDANQFHALKEKGSRNEDDDSRKGILKTVDYGTSMGSEPENFTAREGFETAAFKGER